MAATMGLPIMDFLLNGRVAAPSGNDHPSASPYGVFPSQGDDAWLSVVVTTDEEWAGLRRALVEPEWAQQPEYDTALGRLRRREEINARLAEWTRALPNVEAAERLQAEGVAAAPCLTVMDRFVDEHLNARGDFVSVDHPILGSEPLSGVGIHLSETPGSVRRRAPLLGEHTAEVLSELLGMTEGEIAREAEAGVLT
jgi:crotonobetainyl-CoA:carnitine CoA-transferase CaiB-like acyl-CoA transferase